MGEPQVATLRILALLCPEIFPDHAPDQIRPLHFSAYQSTVHRCTLTTQSWCL